MAGRGAAPAGSCARNMSTRAASGLPPGPLDASPCQELTDRPAIAGNGKRGPVPNKDAANSMRWLECLWRAGRRPPQSQKDRGHYQSAPFGAPPPHLRGKEIKPRMLKRIAERSSHAYSKQCSELHPSP